MHSSLQNEFPITMQPLLWLTSLLVAASVRGDPTVTVKNGTYAGVSLPSLKQDIFLGMPFAQQPLPPLLRLHPPMSLNTSWHGVRDAKAYSPICYGYDVGASTEDAGYELSEACLTMNVIRPAGAKAGTKVPVVAWI
jgi:acetylcholinesterase